MYIEYKNKQTVLPSRKTVFDQFKTVFKRLDVIFMTSINKKTFLKIAAGFLAIIIIIYYFFIAFKHTIAILAIGDKLFGSHFFVFHINNFLIAFFIMFIMSIMMMVVMASYFHLKLTNVEEKTKKIIKDSEDGFRMIIEETPVGVSIIDECGMFEYTNSAFNALYEYGPDELSGKHISAVVFDNLYNMSLENSRDFINENIALSHEWSVITSSGKKLTVLVNSTKINFLGGPKTMLFVVDITERQKMEEDLRKSREELKTARDVAESLNRIKSQFLANVSHEIRTPLNGVIGFSELLSNTRIDKEQEDMLECINSSGKHLLELINDLLDLSRIEAGKFEVEETEFDIEKMVYETVGMVRPAAIKKDLEICLVTNDVKGNFVMTDRHKYKQVLTNLLSNAIKFTPAGKIFITIRQVSEEKDHYTIETSVKDSGIGIAADKLGRIFEPFTQADGSIVRQYGGTGLGLTISNQIVRLLGGEKIFVNSAPSAGSEFYFTIRFKKGKSLIPQKNENETNVSDGETSRLNVLVADDSMVNIKLVRAILEKAGHAVTTVKNGIDAIEEVSRGNFDIVLMDMNMPKLDGCLAAAEIRKRGISIPVIAMTASAMKEDIEKCLGSGMNDFISKPIEVKPFLLKVIEAAKKRAVTDQAASKVLTDLIS